MTILAKKWCLGRQRFLKMDIIPLGVKKNAGFVIRASKNPQGCIFEVFFKKKWSSVGTFYTQNGVLIWGTNG